MMQPSHCESTVTRLWPRALAWLLFLGPTFFICYGFANEYTATRTDIGSFVLNWETAIPFWPWTIYPYMSIDLLYALSLFLCTSKQELNRHSLRLLSATLISVACFLIMPLEFTFPRPATEGVTGMLFDLLTSLDKPYNQAPSLHISLLCIIWYTFSRHTRGLFKRALMHSWMFLIGLSVLTTWQHHFIDIIGGLIVALLVFYLIPTHQRRWQISSQRNYRLASYYAAGAIICAVPAILSGGSYWLALWPAAALTLITIAYLGLGISVFQYHHQRMAFAALILLAPYLLGAHISARILSRKRAGCNEVIAGLWLGRVPRRSDLQHCGATGQLNLTPEMLPLNRPQEGIEREPLLDLAIPDAKQLQQAIQRLDRMLSNNSPVLVHCALGLSRSAVVVAGWLLHSRHAATVEQAVATVTAARPACILHREHIAVLEALHQHREQHHDRR